jgi:hypothetical protein
MNNDLQQLKALAMAATPGPWYVQYGDDERYQCMTAISATNSRSHNMGMFGEEALIAVTFHQSYPPVNLAGDDCGDNDSAYIAAASPDVVLALIARIESLAADAERYRWLRDSPDSGRCIRAMYEDGQAVPSAVDEMISAAIAKEKA